MVKYKDEIQSRPKNEWHKTTKEKKEVKKEARKEISTIKEKFDEYSTQLGKEQRKRDKKRQEKEALQSTSLFGADREADEKKKKNKVDKEETRISNQNQRSIKDPRQDEKEKRKFRGKRNSIGAKMRGFRGGESKNFRRSGGGIGNRDLSGRVVNRGDRSNRGGVAPEGSGKKNKKNVRQRPG